MLTSRRPRWLHLVMAFWRLVLEWIKLQPRKLCQFRPLVESVEELAPVSSLIPGLPTEAPAAAVGRTNEGGIKPVTDLVSGAVDLAKQSAPSISVPSIIPMAGTGVGAAGGAQGFSTSTPTNPSAFAAAPARRPAPNLSRFDDLIALLVPSESEISPGFESAAPASPRAAAQPQADEGGPAPAASSGRGSSNAVSTAAPGAPPAAPIGAGIIRPMTLPPGQTVSRALAASDAQPQSSGGGGATGAPYIHYSGGDGAQGDTRNTNPTVYDLTGDYVQLTVGDNNGYQISTVSWSISSTNLYSGQKDVTMSRNGFTNYPYVVPAGNVAPNPISFDWGENPGNYTISVTVNYVNQNIPQAEATLNANIQKEFGTITVNSMGTPTLTNNGTTVLHSSAANGETGIDFTATVNPAVFQALGLSGNFQVGVIQTIGPFSAYYQFPLGGPGKTAIYQASVLGAYNSGSQSLPRPVVDDADATSNTQASFVGTFYSSRIITVNSSSTISSASVTFEDTPQINQSVNNTYEYFNAQFNDTLMIQPLNGGIWGDLGAPRVLHLVPCYGGH